MFNQIKIKKLKGKKGLFASVVADIWIFLIFVIVIILFIILTSIAQSNVNQRIVEENGKFIAETYFMNYLRTPVTVNGATYSVLDAIPLADYNNINNIYTRTIDHANIDFINSMKFSDFSASTCEIKLEIIENDKSMFGYPLKNQKCKSANPDPSYVINMKAPSRIGSSNSYYAKFSFYEVKK